MTVVTDAPTDAVEGELEDAAATETAATEPNQGKPNEARSNEARPNEARPNEAKPNEARPNEALDNSGEVSDKPARKKTGAAAVAAQIIEDGATSKVGQLAKDMFEGKPTAATQAARILSEIATTKPELLVGTVERMVDALRSKNRRVVQTGADALPAIAKVAPAKVAKHMDALRDAYAETNAVGRDGLVQAFSNLCIASVAYQKRLEPVLCDAMADAEPKVLVGWVETVLPALKGEPHANVRNVVEKRLYAIPKRHAQKIADFLGLKLRVRR